MGKRSYVSELIWHRWLKGEPYESFWENAYRKGTKISSQIRAWLYVRTTSWKWTESEQHTFSPRKRWNLDRSTTESASIIPDKAMYHLTMFRKMTPKLQRIVFIPDLNLRREPYSLMTGSSLVFPARKHLSFCLGSFILSFCSQYWGPLTAAQSTPAPHFHLLIRLRICMFLRSSHGQLPSTLCVEYTVMCGERTWLEIFAPFWYAFSPKLA